MIYFKSDYMEGAHPEVMRRLVETNLEHTSGYGTDKYTEHAKELIREACGQKDADVFLLVGGTQTNSTVIDGLLSHHEGVVAAESGHINVHESGAIEACGHKVLVLPQHDGKVCADELQQFITDFYKDDSYEHCVAPGMLYISHPTELGTLYSLDELTRLSDVCHKADIPMFIDGARLGYGLAADTTDVTLRDIARLSDVFYIGGTKVGAMFGEAVVARKGLMKHFTPLIKQHGALLAKGRLLGVQFETLFTDNLYETISHTAIRMAMKMKRGFIDKGYRLFMDSPTNQQFVILPNDKLDELSEKVVFELWGIRGEYETPVRFVTSWATTEESVDELIAML
jgi:threonine aldolase